MPYNYVYIQDNYVNSQDDYVYMITYYFVPHGNLVYAIEKYEVISFHCQRTFDTKEDLFRE